MGPYAFRRLLQGIPTLLGVTLVTFILLNVFGGDPVRARLGKSATEQDVRALRQEYGLDQSRISLGRGPGVDLALIALGREGWEASVQMARRLRAAGVGCMTPTTERPMGAQMRRADKAGAKFALFVGADELAAGRFGLKDLRTGKQVDVKDNDVAARVKEGIS